FPEPFGLSVALEARSRSLGATCQARARFDGMRRGVEGAEIVNPTHGTHPFALCATGPAFGCPNSFQTNLSLAEAGCRSDSGKAAGPKGEAQDAPSHRRVRPLPLSARYAKRPVRGALRIWRRERDSNPRSGF